MSSHIPAAPGTFILHLDRSDRSVVRAPVIAFEVISSVAYPVCAAPFGGLLKGVRALEAGGFIIDRGFEVPFDSVDGWVQWAMSVEPGSSASTAEETPPAATQTTEQAQKVSEGRTQPSGKPTAAPKARKTFSSKSFWSRVNTQGVTEVVEIEAGMGLPRDAEGFEKIKRDDYAAFKKQAKTGEASVVILAWDDGPVAPGPHEEEVIEQEAGDDEDFGGLV